MHPKISSSTARRLLLACGMALLPPLTALAQAGPPYGSCEALGGQPPAAERLPPYLHGIALSDAQRDRLFELLHAQAPALRERAKSLRRAEGELQSLAFAGDYGDAGTQAALDTVARLQGEMIAARLSLDRQVGELLTPEQRRQLLERLGERDGRAPGRPPRHG